MAPFELRMDGHATGLACAMASRLETRLPFAAFKMCHPLANHASVIFDTDCISHGRDACADVCDSICHELQQLLDQLPPDPHHRERLWPERQVTSNLVVTLRPRQILDES